MQTGEVFASSPLQKTSVNDYRCVADSVPTDLKHEVKCQDEVSEIDERS